MEVKSSRIVNLVKSIDRSVVFIAATISAAIAYYINPLENVALKDWNRTFCSAMSSGISIDARISNFYMLFLLYLPLLFVTTLLFFSFLFSIRNNYKDIFVKLCIFFSCITFASYCSRYAAESTEVNENPMLRFVLCFVVILIIVAVADKKKRLVFKDIVFLFLTYLILCISLDILSIYLSAIMIILLGSIGILFLAAMLLFLPCESVMLSYCKNVTCFLMWIPTIAKISLEIIYYHVENGKKIENYHTLIMYAVIGFAIFSCIFAYVLRNRKVNFVIWGYTGAIVSITVISFFHYAYNITFDYNNLSYLYELGNWSVGMDTYLYGKLPIIDYFSAHALSDVWTQLIYCFIHHDINGILVNPYAGLKYVVAFLILFYIVYHIFDEHVSVLYIVLFPGSVVGIKWATVCCISIAVLLLICKKPRMRSFLLFWFCLLISAFTAYDEGIALGVACILSFILFSIIRKNWKELKQFLICGATVGFGALILYVIYARINGIPIIGRIKEWLSVSAGSSSSWATASFGDQSSFAFLISYYIVPITAVALLVYVVIKYIKTKKHYELAILTTAFALTEILYLTRTMVYHNLAVCSGWTGVLLNFVHWTVSICVLYIFSNKGKSQNVRILTWVGTMMIVIVLEGTAVTHYWPLADSSLLNNGLKMATTWNLRDGVTENHDKPRIVYDEGTEALVTQFKNVFDTLLADNQTFLDFANVTAMYLMTGRKRPCYVGQSPSLLTDLYSQECFLKEIAEYDCPLAVFGTTESDNVLQMLGFPHNIRYYTIAEYLYKEYRPIISFGEFAIWCKKEVYTDYTKQLKNEKFEEKGYKFIDYGYDFTTMCVDKKGVEQYAFMPYHSYDLEKIPYVWANFDKYKAIQNPSLLELKSETPKQYVYEGSQKYLSEAGNYLLFEMTNATDEETSVNLVYYDSKNDGAKTQYYFTVLPGTNKYLIRLSSDYFWSVYNVDTIVFGGGEEIEVNEVRILEGD